MRVPAAIAAISLAAGALALQPDPGVPSPRKAPSALVWSITLPGDIETVEVARRFEQAIADANADGARFINVQLSGASGRWDLAARLADALRASAVPVSTHLPATRRGPAGVAQWLVWLAADQRYAHPDATVRTGADEALRLLAPEETAWGPIEESLTALITDAAPDAPPELARALLFPSERVWALVSASGRPPRLFASRPEPEPDARPLLLVDRSASRGWMVTLAAPTMAQLGFAHEQAASEGALRRAQGSAGLSTREITIDAPLADVRRQAADAFRHADDTIERLGEVLEQRADQSVARDVIRRRGRDVVESAREALEGLARVEESAEQTPELLRTAPPGQTAVGSRPESASAAWRRALQSRADRLNRLKADGQALAER